MSQSSSERRDTSTWHFTERDVILYALSVGCTRKDSRFVYENAKDFCALPTFGVLALHNGALNSVDISGLVPNFNPMLLLHGEQFMELKRPFPTSGKLTTESHVIDVLDKGKNAIVILGTTTRDANGNVIVENEVTTVLRGSGGFEKSKPKPRRAGATSLHSPPERPPDAAVEEVTSDSLAALYRLNGDANPLHIDAEFANLGGFPNPILHGLCSFGMAGKHVLQKYGAGEPGNLKSIKGRFAKHVFPGETLRTEMWVTSPTEVVFQLRVVERDVLAVSNAAVTFDNGVLGKNSKL